ncbi:MAG: lactate racemase domain-containing protein [Lentisphaeria bacterium]|nr:lactate racemase domain-containing protein [Lentisphaeria bacterium]
MMYVQKGGADAVVSDAELAELVLEAIAKSGKTIKRMLLLPPDHTRLNSRAGRITEIIYANYADKCHIDIMPALGTHSAMGDAQLEMMFGRDIPKSAFKVHDWRHGVVALGKASSDFIRELSDGKLDYEVKVEVDKIVYDNYDLIVSIGQVVPHEVVGMANYTKNIMVGIGGSDMINKSHFLGATCNLEKIMGHANSPVRRLFNYGVDTYLSDLPILYMQTVMARDEATGQMVMRGFFAGEGEDPFLAAAKLSVETNLQLLDRPLKKVVVYLDPEEFKSTWLGNKAVYRTRMAIADDGDLIILAPGLKEFGEDPENDRIIRKYGYKGTPNTLKMVAENQELRDNLGAAAHLIHGSSEGRFRITYCPGPQVTEAEIRSVGFEYGDLDAMLKKYDVSKLKDGMNLVDGEEIFYISNPALGLWALRSAFTE